MPALDANGVLPPGRHRVSEAEVKATFMDTPALAGSTRRPILWADWLKGIALLRGSVKVHAAWIGGSFVTSALDPSDIDVVFVVSGEDFLRRPVPERKLVESFERFVKGPLGNNVRAHGLQLDSYLLYWVPRLSPDLHTDGDRKYVQDRGYWDDFWSRHRSTPKPGPFQRHDVLPTRGYLEVMFDDFA